MRTLLNPLRDYYLDCFQQSIAKAHSRFDKFTTELLLEIPSWEHPEHCYRLYRADIIGKRGDENGVLEVNVTPKPLVAWQKNLPSNVHILGPLVWNSIEFRLVSEKPNEKSLADWTAKWLDITDSRLDETAQFQCVIHNVSPPQTAPDGYKFSIDFGSAPVDAFEELLLLLGQTVNISLSSYFV